MVLHQTDAVTEAGADIIHGLRIISTHLSPGSQQLLDGIERWCLPYIICIGLESQPPNTYRPAGEITAKMLFQLIGNTQSLVVIDIHYRLQDAEIVGILLRCLRQRLHVLGETATSVAHTRKQKPLTNTAIAAHTHAHHIYIGPYPLTQIGNLIHESNPRSQVSIGCVLGHLR